MTFQFQEQRDLVSSSSDDWQFLAIEPDMIESAWPVAAPFLELAARLSKKTNLEVCYAGAKKRYCQLWIIWEPTHDDVPGDARGAVLTDIQYYPSGWHAARVLLMGGVGLAHMKDTIIAELEKWARAEDCDALEIIGRKGWGRVFPDYKPEEYVHVKEFYNNG